MRCHLCEYIFKVEPKKECSGGIYMGLWEKKIIP